jgi:hypothetical protein
VFARRTSPRRATLGLEEERPIELLSSEAARSPASGESFDDVVTGKDAQKPLDGDLELTRAMRDTTGKPVFDS